MSICNYCNTEFNNKYALIKHKKTSKYCFKIREELFPNTVIEKKMFECEYCKKELTSKNRLITHLKICKTKKTKVENELKQKNDTIVILQKEFKKIKDEMIELKKNDTKSIFNENILISHQKIKEINLSKNQDYKFGVPISSDVMNANGLCNTSEKIYEQTYLDGLSTDKLILDIEYEKEKSAEDLYKEKIESLSNQLERSKQENQTLLVKHNSSLKTHRYIKFKEKGPCFYIIEQGIPCECKYNTQRKKFGIAGLGQDTFDDRLRSHRTIWPQLKVNFIIFMKEVDILESSIKRIYKKEINPNGHEIIEGITTDQIINSISKIIDALGIIDYKFKLFILELKFPTHTHF